MSTDNTLPISITFSGARPITGDLTPREVLWVLFRGDDPMRAYYDETRAREDYALTQLASSQPDRWHLTSAPLCKGAATP